MKYHHAPTAYPKNQPMLCPIESTIQICEFYICLMAKCAIPMALKIREGEKSLVISENLFQSHITYPMIESPISVPYRNRPFVLMLSLDLVDALPFAL